MVITGGPPSIHGIRPSTVVITTPGVTPGMILITDRAIQVLSASIGAADGTMAGGIIITGEIPRVHGPGITTDGALPMRMVTIPGITDHGTEVTRV